MVSSAALMFLAGGLACLTAVAFPLIATEHLDLLLFEGVLGCAIATGLWLWGMRLPDQAFPLLAGGASLLVSLIVANCSSAAAVKTAALAYPCVAVYYGHAFSRRMAYLQWLVFAFSFGAALLIGGFSDMAAYWAMVAITVLAVGVGLSCYTEALRRRADTDRLTGLLNRNGLADAAVRVDRRGSKRGVRYPRALVMIDIDGFKQINDTMGHPVGDRLLADLARAWRACLRERDVLARTGGDEFVLLMPDTSRRRAQELLCDMRKAVVSVAGRPVAWSHGLHMWRQEESIEEGMARADKVLYENKRRPGLRRDLAG
jgi:diguanylate cyclase (GGDEF)-like protein